ncbi:MAG: UbiD family decarboxylase [Candidatus Bathyarchaeia archaeon]
MSSLREFLWECEKLGEVTHISAPLSVDLEVAAAMKLLDAGNVLKFENIEEYPGRSIVANLCGDRRRISQALKVDEAMLHWKILEALENPLAPEIKKDWEGYEVKSTLNLHNIPALKYFDGDGGRYITASVVASKGVDGKINASIHRLMIVDGGHLAIRIVPRHLYKMCREAEGMGEERLPIAVAIGLHPAVLVAAAAPAPYRVNEFEVANTLLHGGLKLSQTERYGIPVPSGTEVLIEGDILLREYVDEGPFVDLTGTYDIVRKQPLIEVSDIYLREDFIYHAILPSGSEHRILMGLPYEARIRDAVSRVTPEVRDVYLTPGGCGWFNARISLRKQSEGDPKNAIMAAFGAHPSLKSVIILDEDVDVSDDVMVEWAVTTRAQPSEDIVVIGNARGSSLDPSADQERLLTSKVGVDATCPMDKPSENFKRAQVKITDRVRRAVGDVPHQ